MTTQDNDAASLQPLKEVVIQHHHNHNNNFSAESHSTLPPTYEQSTNPQYLLSPNQESLNYNNNIANNHNGGSSGNSTHLINNEKNNNNLELSSSPMAHSLLNSPAPSAPPVEFILDGESPPLSVTNPNFHSNTFPNSHPNSSSPHPIINENNSQHHLATQRDYATQQPVTEREGNFVKTRCNFIKPMADKRNWSALIYLLLLDLIFSILCFIWIVITFCISIPMMSIPPIGYFLLTWSTYSWKALSHVQFSIFNCICQPSQDISLPPAYVPHESDQGCLIQILTDSFTIRSFAYFVFIKLWLSLLATVCCLITFVIGVIFLLLPVFMPMYREIVELELKIQKSMLGLNNEVDVMMNESHMVVTV